MISGPATTACRRRPAREAVRSGRLGPRSEVKRAAASRESEDMESTCHRPAYGRDVRDAEEPMLAAAAGHATGVPTTTKLAEQDPESGADETPRDEVMRTHCGPVEE